MSIATPDARQILPGAGKICRAHTAATGLRGINCIKIAGPGLLHGKNCPYHLIALDG
jgi:hypothetical protein